MENVEMIKQIRALEEENRKRQEEQLKKKREGTEYPPLPWGSLTDDFDTDVGR